MGKRSPLSGRRSCSRMLGILSGAFFSVLAAGAARPADFAYGIEGIPERIQGQPGEVRTFEFYATLTTANNDEPEGAQGWSLSFFSDAGIWGERIITGITLKGIIVSTIYDQDHDENPATPPIHHDPYEQDLGAPEVFTNIAHLTVLWDDVSKKGVVSAVVLRSQERMVLQPEGTQRIAKMTAQVTIPDGEDCVPLTFRFIDGAHIPFTFSGLNGPLVSSQPANNVVTFKGGSMKPALGSATVLLCPARFRRGDFNDDGRVDISDPIGALWFLFLEGAPPGCSDSADSNDDSKVDISDPVLLLMDLFLPGSEGLIPPPGPLLCGPDPQPDPLTCDRSSRCP